MNILFVGASKFGYTCCEELLQRGFEVKGILTNQESFNISYAKEGVKNVNYADFSGLAQTNNIPLYRMKNNMKEPALQTFIENLEVDVAVVIGWYHMITKSMLAKLDYFGIHASKLPYYSGGAPLVWAIINGESETGVTLFKFADGVDNGDVVEQATIPIALDDTIRTVYKHVEKVGKRILVRGLTRMRNGDFNFLEQDESKRTIFPQRTPEDGRLDEQLTALEAYNFIRAQTKPYPGAFLDRPDQRIKLWTATISQRPDMEEVEELGKRAYLSNDGRTLHLLCADNQWLTTNDFTYETID
jgi:methionyl-tRNA formyltransferase